MRLIFTLVAYAMTHSAFLTIRLKAARPDKAFLFVKGNRLMILFINIKLMNA